MFEGRTVRRSRQPTATQLRVLELLAHGRTEAEVAAELGITPTTARTHTGDAMRRLGVHTRTEAVAIAICEGWIKCPRA